MTSIIRLSAPSRVAIMVDERDISDGISCAVCDILLNKGKRFMKVAFVGAKGMACERKMNFSQFMLIFADR